MTRRSCKDIQGQCRPWWESPCHLDPHAQDCSWCFWVVLLTSSLFVERVERACSSSSSPPSSLHKADSLWARGWGGAKVSHSRPWKAKLPLYRALSFLDARTPGVLGHVHSWSSSLSGKEIFPLFSWGAGLALWRKDLIVYLWSTS